MVLLEGGNVSEAQQAAQNVIDEANVLIETIQGFVPKIINFGINIIIALIIFIIGKVLISMILKFAGKLLKRSSVDESVCKFLNSVLKVVLYILLIIIICSRIGIETTSLIAIFTSASLAVGLALQGALSNFAGGIMILLIKPFKLGDYVVAGGVEGVVERIDLFYTRLVTLDNKLVLVPNGELTASIITNATAFEKRRVDVEVSISYPDDIDKARATIMTAIAKTESILPDEPVQVVVGELGNHGVQIKVRVWTQPATYWDVLFALQENIKKKLDENGVTIPYNQLDVHIVKEDGQEKL